MFLFKKILSFKDLSQNLEKDSFNFIIINITKKLIKNVNN